MSLVFLSHSSSDNVAAVALGDWLKEEGWDDVFLDLDPAQGIHPGERWERALYEQAASCEAVLFLVSRNWLNSEWCRREYELARKLNKRIFIVLIDDIPIAELPEYLTATHQAVSLASGADHRIFHPRMPVTHEEGHVGFSAEGLARLKAGLTRAGLDPKFFAWPPAEEPDRAPWRGLEALSARDAGVFFGRDANVIEALDALRGLREGAPPRLLVLLGASGAGKSSFLRAGLLPRLARDEAQFVALPPIRPERAAVTGANGLVAALAAAAQPLGVTLAQIREAARQGAAALAPILRRLAARKDAAPATIVIAIDQAEELFRPEGAAEGEALLTLLRDLVAGDDPPVAALFAIRSDAYDALERARPLEGLRQQALPLPPMPRGAYQTVIERPAQRLAEAGRKFVVDPALTRALLEDIDKGGGADALPLLAFTLEQLWRDHGAAGKMTLADYQGFEGLKGAIDGAVARAFTAADADPRIPKDREARLALLRRGLIPWLAGVDPQTRTARRRVARAAQIPAEAAPLIELLVEQRLLTRDVDPLTGEATIEPAHEALLRQWGGLKGWLEEDFGRLAALEGVKRAARDWDANDKNLAWAAHAGARLAEAGALDARPDLAEMLDAVDRAYLAACREKEREAAEREKAAQEAETARLRAEAASARYLRRVAQVAGIGAVVALALAGAVAWQWTLALAAQKEAAAQRDRAEKTLALATKTADALTFDMAQKFRDLGLPAKLRGEILDRARQLQAQLAQGGGESAAMKRSRAAALAETVDSRLATGDVKGALDAAREAVAIMEALSASDPGNAGWRRDLSVSYGKVGNVLVTQGDLPGALKAYRDSLAIIEKLSASDPSNTEWQRDLSVSNMEVGNVLVARGDLPVALEAYRDSLAIVEKLSASDPGNVGWRRDLSVSYEKVGNVLVAQGDLPGALNAYHESLAIIEKLSASDPGNASWRHDLWVSYLKVGNALAAQGDLPGALKAYRDSLAIIEKLSASDPSNTEWRRDLSVSYNFVGNIFVAQGDLPAALKAYREYQAIIEKLSGSDHGNAGWRRDLSVSYIKVGDVLKAQGDLPGALKAYRDALAIIEQLSASDSGNAEWRRDLAISNERIGDMLVRNNDRKRAVAAFETALEIYDALVRSHPDNAEARLFSIVPLSRLAELDPGRAREHLDAALAILEPLAAADRLDADRRGWIPELKAARAALDAKPKPAPAAGKRRK